MNNPSRLPNLENDYRVFLWFLTLTTAGAYIWAVTTSPDRLQKPLALVICTILIIASITLHWFADKIYCNQRLMVVYVIGQGALAFAIILLTRIELMNYALFLALVGEAIGMWGLTRRGLLACGFYLALSMTSFAILNGVGGVMWWLVGSVPAVLFVGIYVMLYNRQTQANERARTLLGELESANQQMSAYAAQVEDLTIAAERQRMARELHDTLSQGLAGLILQLEAADAHLAQDHPEKARQIVQQTMNQARVTLGEARRAIDDLRHAAESTLEDTIQQAAGRFSTATGIPCNIEIDLPADIPPAQRDAIARILPEALNNIQKHAQAKRVSIHLSSGGGDGTTGGDGTAGGLRLEICDDGIGFDAANTPPGHYGVIGMRERTRLAGGELNIESRPGEGTRLVVTFPAAEEQA
jgi:NarL family two-component system sensor histidine kinase YdfH